MSRVAVLMSGGVDSTAAALLLQREGQEVVGITALMRGRGGVDDDGAELARRTSGVLGIHHEVLDLREEFDGHVLRPFRTGYLEGRTPNPCSMCNRDIKFGVLFDAAMARGCDLVATGHYAGLGEYGGRVTIREPASAEKSQTYFLALLRPGILERLTFPLEHLTKNEAGAIVAERGLVTRSRESQDLCFVTSGRYEEFLRKEGAGAEPGPLLDTKGNVVGRHRGHVAYTIGQRLGHGGRRTYVIEKRPETNEIVVGDRELAMATSIAAGDAVWFCAEGGLAGGRLMVKYRYNSPAVSARLHEGGEGRFTVITDEPCFAPAPGQVLACYREGYLIGGGVITRTAQGIT
jgi:tRNA-specific 2-thiouridylase